jgi:hypothetical protein
LCHHCHIFRIEEIPDLRITKQARFLLISLCVAVNGFAYRPFYTDDAGTVPDATFEAEAAADYGTSSTTLGLALKHGITERMDIGVSVGRCVHPQHERGFDNAELGLKFALIPDLIAASFTAFFADPEYSSLLIASKSFGPASFHANGGFSATGSSDHVTPIFGFAGDCRMGRFSAGAELMGTDAGITWWQAAIRFEITASLIVDSGIGGNFDNSAGVTATTGLFFAFPVKGEK